jgi:asparagine synthase (glutamine-hydrolysing)
MCGIAGFIQFKPFDAETVLSRMSDRLHHRGPDDEGTYMDKNAGIYLAHRRLSIIDVSEAGRQPIGNEDGCIQAVVNGEFYNYQGLRTELLSAGHRFHSRSDSEILVHGYEQWGEAFFEKLDGIFAFALWDGASQRLYLVRDPLGVKPLVYMATAAGIFFSSEAQVFHALPRDIFSPTFDREGLHQLICFQYIYDPEKTAYRGVRRLLPGSFLRFQNGSVEQKTYWTLTRKDDHHETMDIAEAAVAVETTLREAIHSQMAADVPVGILLSGGIDSSVVAALAQEGRPQPIRTFTAGFSHALDERPYAREVARHIGSVHQEFMVDPRQINNRLDDMVPKLDDLTSLDGGMFTTLLLSEQVARFGVKVLLVGEGSDEIFGGYSWFGMSRFPFNLVGTPVRSALFYYCISRMLPSKMNLRHIIDINRIMMGFGHDDIFRTISAFEITRQLPNHFLMKVDHGTMALGLEARVPLLDRKLVELVFSLPDRVKLKGPVFSFQQSHEKWVLREVARKLLPPEIAGRQKRGFSIPMPEVLQSNADKMRDLLLHDDSVARAFFNPEHIDWLMGFKNTMYSPLHKHREFLCWRLLLIEIWRRHYGVSL